MPANVPTYVPNRRDVAHEAFEGEVILIHFPSGHYFRLDEAGKAGWRAVERGATQADVAAAFQRAFDVEAAVAEGSAAAFLAALSGHGLIVEGAPPPDRPPEDPPPASRRAFRAPHVEVFSDLQELFLVDPIHEVDDAGWPHAKP